MAAEIHWAENNAFSYTICRRKGMKQVKLTVRPHGIVVTAPPKVPELILHQFVLERSEWIKEKLAQMPIVDLSKLLIGTIDDYKRYKEAARILLTKRLYFFNEHYNFTFDTIRIKRHKTLWGSCSSKGNLNFNYQLVKLPIELVDYVVVHELCHLKEFNHSSVFWDLVGETIPDYMTHRKALREWRWTD